MQQHTCSGLKGCRFKILFSNDKHKFLILGCIISFFISTYIDDLDKILAIFSLYLILYLEFHKFNIFIYPQISNRLNFCSNSHTQLPNTLL